MIKTVKKYLIPHEGNSYKPHLLREQSLSAIFCLAFLLFCTSLGSSYIINKTDFGATVLPAVLVDLTNDHRLANNGKALTINPILEQAALMKAKDMAENNYFAHTSPSGATPWQWFSKAGYRFVYAGENLAINFTESLDVENAWIASPTHHANLVSDKFDETGIATYQGTYQGRPTTFVVQLFGKQPQVVHRVAPAPIVAKAQPQVSKTVQKIALASPEVKGESIYVKQAPIDLHEPAPVLVLNEPTFAIAKNLNESEPASSQSSTQLSVTKYSTLVERLIVNQVRYVQYIYLGFILLVYLVLVFMIVVEFRTQHIKNIALGILLLCFLGVLAYLNSSFILSFV